MGRDQETLAYEKYTQGTLNKFKKHILPQVGVKHMTGKELPFWIKVRVFFLILKATGGTE